VTYRWVEHTAEIELAIEETSPEGILAEALVALGDVLPEDRGGDRASREIEIDAPDLPALLAEWLNELVYLAERDGFVAERVERLHLDGTRLSAVVSGSRASPQSLIKAVTYHRLEMKELDGGRWSARVTVDV
jgi:SHS2 domain-containing protein